MTLSFFRFLYRFIGISLTITCFLISNSLISILLVFAPFKRRKILIKLNAFYSRCILKILNFRLSLQGPLPQGGQLIVGNHMSYLDILIYLSFFETCFVTSVDMKHRLFLGQITILGGCLYVERRNPRGLHKEMSTLKKYFEREFSVCIFPEGTSTNGETVLPFKKSLFQIAVETKTPVQPISLKYKTVNGEAFSQKNRDLVCWYGDLNFFSHLCKLMTLKEVTASLTPLPTIDTSVFSDRKSLSNEAHRVILEQYHKI